MGIGGLRTYITIVPVSLVRHFSLQGGLSFPRSWGRFFNRGPFIEPLDFWLRLIFWAEAFGGREWLLLQEFFPVRFRLLTLKSMLSSSLCFFAQPDCWYHCC
jgi:hypothetical protein